MGQEFDIKMTTLSTALDKNFSAWHCCDLDPNDELLAIQLFMVLELSYLQLVA